MKASRRSSPSSARRSVTSSRPVRTSRCRSSRTSSVLKAGSSSGTAIRPRSRPRTRSSSGSTPPPAGASSTRCSFTRPSPPSAAPRAGSTISSIRWSAMPSPAACWWSWCAAATTKPKKEPPNGSRLTASRFPARRWSAGKRFSPACSTRRGPARPNTASSCSTCRSSGSTTSSRCAAASTSG